MKKFSIIFLLVALLSTVVVAQNVEGTVGARFDDPKMDWWKEAKFGLFIHWGIYSVPAGKWGNTTTYNEWIMQQAKIPRATYAALANDFMPNKFNADNWVKMAQAAGQKYIVITAKHHDGFAMFDSKASSYNVVAATPFKQDVLKALAESCRKYNMKLGFYYSQAQDWYHPGGAIYNKKEWDSTHLGNMAEYIDKIAVPQVKEIVSNYGDVAVLWWDTPTNMTKAMSQQLADLLKPYPHIITNNRLGAGIGGDVETPEQIIPATGFPNRNWEVCMTMNGHWGYNAWDDRWKSTKDLLRKLIDINSKGGNFLLNVGPDQYGEIPAVCQQTLLEMGDWLSLNGEAIYGTTANPFPSLSYGRATRKGQTIYLHVFDWPKNGRLNVPLLNTIKKAYLLADKKVSLKVDHVGEHSILHLPSYAPDKMASVIAIEFEGEPKVLPAPMLGKNVTASSTKEGTAIAYLNDGNPKNKWQPLQGDSLAWVQVDLLQPTAINGFTVVEPFKKWDNHAQNLALQYQDGLQWKTAVAVQTEGSGHTVYFDAVTAQHFRLTIQDKKGEPTLNEWLLFRAE